METHELICFLYIHHIVMLKIFTCFISENCTITVQIVMLFGICCYSSVLVWPFAPFKFMHIKFIYNLFTEWFLEKELYKKCKITRLLWKEYCDWRQMEKLHIQVECVFTEFMLLQFVKSTHYTPPQWLQYLFIGSIQSKC